MRSLAIERLFINVKSSASTADQNYVKAQLSNALLATGSSWFIIDNTDALDSLQVTITILNLIFSVLTAVAMFLCFFSLLASMLANINEQQKEIGVLLAIGLKSVAVVCSPVECLV
jgi:ABC-type antimicrobial peptide transport system permease subunit